MSPGPPPGWGQWPPAGRGGPPGNHWQLSGDENMRPADGQLAGFGSRLGGYLLDSLLYGLVFAVFAIPGTVLGIGAFDGCNSFDNGDTTEIVCPPGAPKGGMLAAGIALGVVGAIVVAVLYVRALGRTGQTWGRKIVGVKVVGKDSRQPLGSGKAFLRVLVAGIVSGNCVLGYLWMLWDKDKQTWHDKIVGSVVLKV
jgi:uncharacterized RDD family membrane protein YckC